MPTGRLSADRVLRGSGALALALGLAVLAQPALLALDAEAGVDAKKKPAPAAPAELVLSRPDPVSAALTARLQGARVEIESARTESSTSWANPDGTTTVAAHSGPIRYLENGVWHDVDLTLTTGPDGAPTAKKHARKLKLAGRTDAATEELITVAEGPGREVAFGWKGKLPAPTVEGTRATYREISPGVDMVVESRRSGFEQNFVLNTAPAGPVSWEMPLRTKGLTPRPEADGSVSFVNAKAKVVSVIAAPIAWDAAVNPNTGDHLSTSPVSMTVTQTGKGKAVLTLTPDPVWLTDPARVLPITIDPLYATFELGPNFDAFVQEGVTTDQSTSTELKLGNNGSGQRARSFIKFGSAVVDTVMGKDVIAAELFLHATHSWSCSPRNWQVWDTNPAGAATRWTSQPTWGESRGASSATKGYSSSCSAGWVSANITNLVRGWWVPNGGARTLGLRAENEADAYGWKKFSSSETTNDPYIQITYNQAPDKATTPTVSPVATYSPPGGPAALFTPVAAPSFQAKASDDAALDFMAFTVYNTSGGVAASCTDLNAATNQIAGCQITAVLAPGTYTVTARATDDRGLQGAPSTPQTFTVAAAAPAQPTVACDRPANSWSDEAPAQDVACTITVTGSGPNSPGAVSWIVDPGPNAATTTQTIAQPVNGATKTVGPISLPRTPGGHVLRAWASNPAGLPSAVTEYGFGYGSTVGLTAPKNDPVTVTTKAVAIQAAGPKGPNANAIVQWRPAGSGDPNSAWNTAAGGDVDLKITPGIGEQLDVKGSWYLDRTVRAPGSTLNPRVPARLEMQVCLVYGGAPACSGSGVGATGPVEVQYVPHAFGNGFPTADAVVGQVALWTGEFQTDATDVSVTGYAGPLSISRSHTTFDAAPAGPFGPGWLANFDGPDAGVAGWQVVDSTRQDGTLSFIDSEGSALVFRTANGLRRTDDNSLATQAYLPANEDSELSGVRLQVAGTGTGTTLTLIEDDGTKTTFLASTAPAGQAFTFTPHRVTQPGVPGHTAFERDGEGRISRIISPQPDNAPCSPVAGCRSLRLVYGTAGNGVPGQVREVYLDLWNPSANGGEGAVESTKVAAYAYGALNRLMTVTDSRANLATRYGYDGDSSRLASVQPAGLTAFQLHYADRGSLKALANVTRQLPGSSQDAVLTSFVYDINPDRAGLPDVSGSASTGVKLWKQQSVPTYAAAVFGASHPAAGISPADINDNHWVHASLMFTDPLGYTVNTADHGGPDGGGTGGWQLTATDYDTAGNIERHWDADAIAGMRDGRIAALDAAYQAATEYTYNEAYTVAGVLTPAGTLLTDVLEPARNARAKDGLETRLRVRTHTAYDTPVGATVPDNGLNPASGQPYRLATRVLVTTETGDPATSEMISDTRYGYAGLGGESGWKLGVPTTVTTAMGGGENPELITRTTKYDSDGRVTEIRQPKSAAGNGSDAGTRRYTYYTAGNNPGACQNTRWLGMLCQITPGDGAGSVLPTITTTSYHHELLAPLVVEEKRGGTTRTTTFDYKSDGRPTLVTTAVTGLNGSEPVKGTTTVYNDNTGLPIELVQLNGTTPTAVKDLTGYDSWGRVTTYQPAGTPTTTTTYDNAGRVASVANPTGGTTTWSYDGTDALGKPEHRGLPTGMTVSNPGGPAVEFSAAYTSGGALKVQKLPGGITQSFDYNEVGQPTGLAYRGQVPGGSPDAVWLAWSTSRDALGRAWREWTPEGAAFTGGAGNATGYDRQYSYDLAGRLLTVQDRTASADNLTAGCQTRQYKFDDNGNREKLTRYEPGTGGSCAKETEQLQKAWTFDGADRLTAGAKGVGTYDYDNLGRVTSLPGVDTQLGDSTKNLAIGYFDTDAVRSLTQDKTATRYDLDVAGRRAGAITEAEGNRVKTITRHYADTSDNPAWIVSDIAGQGVTTIRQVGALGGGIGTEITNAGAVTLRLANPHGDTVATVPITSNGGATGITAWSDYDEYGNPSDTTYARTVGGAVGYAWLGGKERGTDDLGLVLMGARLYNPDTAQFTSLDPIFGGNETAYSYPGDPVNAFDLDGRGICWKVCETAKKALDNSFVRSTIVTVAIGFCPISAGAGCVMAVGLGVGAGLGALNYGVNAKDRSAGGFARATLGGAAEGGMNAAMGRARAQRLKDRGLNKKGPRPSQGQHGKTRGKHAEVVPYGHYASPYDYYIKHNKYINRGMF